MLDAAGDTTLACMVTGYVDFGDGPLRSGYFIHVASARFDAGQALAWSEAFGDVGAMMSDLGAAPAGGGAIVVVGDGTGSMDLGDGPLLGGDHQGGFVAWLDADGHPVWSRGFAGDGDLACASAAVTPAGDVVYAGSFTGTVELVDGPTSAMGSSDLFVVKLAP